MSAVGEKKTRSLARAKDRRDPPRPLVVTWHTSSTGFFFFFFWRHPVNGASSLASAWSQQWNNPNTTTKEETEPKPTHLQNEAECLIRAAGRSKLAGTPAPRSVNPNGERERERGSQGRAAGALYFTRSRNQDANRLHAACPKATKEEETGVNSATGVRGKVAR